MLEAVPYSILSKKNEVKTEIDSKWCYYSLMRLQLISWATYQKKLKYYCGMLDNDTNDNPIYSQGKIYDFEKEVLGHFETSLSKTETDLSEKSLEIRKKIFQALFEGFVYNKNQIKQFEYVFVKGQTAQQIIAYNNLVYKYFFVENKKNLPMSEIVRTEIDKFFLTGQIDFRSNEIYKWIAYSSIQKNEKDSVGIYKVLSYVLSGKKRCVDIGVLMEFLGLEEVRLRFDNFAKGFDKWSKARSESNEGTVVNDASQGDDIEPLKIINPKKNPDRTGEKFFALHKITVPKKKEPKDSKTKPTPTTKPAKTSQKTSTSKTPSSSISDMGDPKPENETRGNKPFEFKKKQKFSRRGKSPSPQS